MNPSERWPDDRLDELNRRVIRTEQMIPDVAVMEADLKTLAKELQRNTEATRKVASQLEEAKLEPLTRGRQVRTQLMIGVVCALLGGIFVLFGALVHL